MLVMNGCDMKELERLLIQSLSNSFAVLHICHRYLKRQDYSVFLFKFVRLALKRCYKF